jgi:hypothetical protein
MAEGEEEKEGADEPLDCCMAGAFKSSHQKSSQEDAIRLYALMITDHCSITVI